VPLPPGRGTQQENSRIVPRSASTSKYGERMKAVRLLYCVSQERVRQRHPLRRQEKRSRGRTENGQDQDTLDKKKTFIILGGPRRRSGVARTFVGMEKRPGQWEPPHTGRRALGWKLRGEIKRKSRTLGRGLRKKYKGGGSKEKRLM